MRSTNGGGNWLIPQRISFAPDDSSHSYLVALNGLVHLAWGDERATQIGVYYRQSGDRGGTWSPEEFVGPAAGKTSPFTAATSNYVHATWPGGGYRRRALSTSQPPSITTQPVSQAVTAGQTATFSVAAAAGTAPLAYQWRKNGSNIGGATSASYTTPEVTTGDSGSVFSVVVSNAAGSVTSTNATLTVAPPPGNGNGLSAAYYDNMDFTGPSVLQVDSRIDFNWGEGSPDPAIGADTFSAR